jgi:outer membrane protein OmpA-like peptidoglycan-associated protein
VKQNLRWSNVVFCCLLLARVAGAQKAPSSPIVPLCEGLTIVTAISSSAGDYESIKSVELVNGVEVHLKYSAEVYDSDWLGGPGKLRNIILHRTMLVPDLQTAKMYQQIYLEKSAETIPGATSIGTSAVVLRDLKTKGEAELSVSNAYSGLELSGDRNKFPSYYHYMQGGRIQKLAATRIPVLLNDKMSELPAIQAQGDLVGKKVEFFFLDDERNPLALAYRIDIGGFKPLTPEQRELCDKMQKAAEHAQRGTGNHPDASVLLASLGGGFRCNMPNGGDRETLRVVKINARCTGPAGMLAAVNGGIGQPPNGAAPGGAGSIGAKALEKALEDSNKVDIYSIYFSFNSDKLREESQPTLKDIAEVLRHHPDWKLQINGHTDGIGSDAFNLDLSKHRAAAVKDALTKQYSIAPNRLATSGYGKSQPKDTNETLEGRAHNRRVELMRIS